MCAQHSGDFSTMDGDELRFCCFFFFFFAAATPSLSAAGSLCFSAG
jgi:hypothetical protein